MLRRLLPLAFLLPLVFAGCDTADDGGDTFPLPSDVNHRASFDFDAGTLEAGETFASDPVTQNSQAVINDSRYGPADIASARIREGSVEINLRFPVDAQEVQIREAILTLDAPDVGEQVVARGEDFSLVINSTTAPQRQTLQIVNANITEYLRQEEFTGRLMLDIAGAGTGNYQFTVRFDVDASVTIDAVNRVHASF